MSAALPASGYPDVVGAFRFICGAGQLTNDDPIMYPGQPGKSHLHQFYGNTSANANSTYSSLRSAGDSTCNWMGNGTASNRSAYWMPAMLDGKGNVVRPDYVSIYYKQRPQSDPTVTDPSNPKYLGRAVPLPNGLRYIFGWDPTGRQLDQDRWRLVQLPGAVGEARPLSDPFDGARQLPRRQSGRRGHRSPGMLGRQAPRQRGSPQPRRLRQLRHVGLSEVPVDAPVQHSHLHDGRVVLRRARGRHHALGAIVGPHGSGTALGSHLPRRLVRGLGQ